MNPLCIFNFFVAFFPQLCPQHGDVLSVFSDSNELLNIRPKKISLPDTTKNPFVYLEQHGYSYENHTIITEDGYILLTVRIPYGKKRSFSRKRPPVILLHGIFCTFYDFLNSGQDTAFGFQILEEGYDIWLMNARGNTYNKRHVKLDPVLDESEFWDFSWHEIGYYDVAANMDYIRNITGYSNVSFVGHSQGGSAYLALAASRPEYDKRITFSVLLAPVSYCKHVKQPFISTISKNFGIFDAIAHALQWNEILPYRKIYSHIANLLCNLNSPFIHICADLLTAVAGPSDQINGSLITILCITHPAGASINQFRHYMQIAISDKFQQFDYGSERNKIVYKQERPPLYNLSAITSPSAIYSGESDYFVSPIDVARLVSRLRNVYYFPLGRDTNHLDVQWGAKALENIFRPAIKLLNKYNKMQ